MIESESEVVITVTYIGSNPLGAIFYASICGNPPPQRLTVLPIATNNKRLPAVRTMITAVLDRPLDISRLEIEDTDDGASDWVVNDISIDGTSIFLQPGNMPGDMFAYKAVEHFVKFRPGTRIELLVTYRGLNEDGCCLTARFLGTVVRDDLQQPPPDVHAIIRTSGEDFDEEVVARCNWRAPYVST